MGFDELVVGVFKFLLIIIGVLFLVIVVQALPSRRSGEIDDRDKKRLDDKPPANPPDPPKDGG